MSCVLIACGKKVDIPAEKKAYQAQLEIQLDDMEQKIDVMGSKIEKAGDKVKTETSQALDTLKEKQRKTRKEYR